jgi:hypothetical protein
LLALIGVILIVTTVVVDWQDGRVPDGWLTTTAVVTDEIHPPDPCFRNCDMDYWIEVSVSGKTIGHIYDGPAELHERLPFAYDPNGSRWKVMNQGRYVPWTMGLPGVLLLGAAGILTFVSVSHRDLRPS